MVCGLISPQAQQVRFEPGEKKTVRLISIGGDRIGYGLNGLVNGKMDDENIKQAAFEKAKKLGFKGGVGNDRDIEEKLTAICMVRQLATGCAWAILLLLQKWKKI